MTTGDYRASYEETRIAVENYPRVAFALQLRHLALTARSEALWGAVDALSDLLIAGRRNTMFGPATDEPGR